MDAIGIDIGSTSIKGAVLHVDSRCLGTPVTRRFPAPLAGLPAGHVEIDPRAVSDTVADVLTELVAAHPGVGAVYLSSQMGGLLLLDGHGRPRTNYLSWRDERSAAGEAGSTLALVRAAWERHGDLVTLGSELQAGSATSLAAWLATHGHLPAGATLAGIGEAVAAGLVGEGVPMHATAAIGLLDLERGGWHHEALGRIGLESLHLPALAASEAPVGTTVVAGRRLEVHGPYGDQPCALRGAGLAPDELSLNISTGSQVSRLARAFAPGPYQTRRAFGGMFLDTVTHLPAGRSLELLVDLLVDVAAAEGVSLTAPWESIQRRVAAVADTDLDVDLAFFPGPLGAHGSVRGITTGNLTVGSLFLAAYRAMADAYACVAARFGPVAWREVVVSGGLVRRTPRLRALLAERFVAPLRESPEEETLLGLLDIACENARAP
jgi:sugar (pentulose or hexulose) kinase